MIYQVKQDLNPIGRTQARVVGIVGTICLVKTRKDLSGDFHGFSLAREESQRLMLIAQADD